MNSYRMYDRAEIERLRQQIEAMYDGRKSKKTFRGPRTSAEA